MNFKKSIKKYVTGLVVIFSIFTLVFGEPHVIEAATPTVVTNPATNISKTGALLVGVITDDGGQPITADGFEFGLTVGYGQTISGTERYVQTAEFGSEGSGNTQFESPRGIDIGTSGDIYIADTGNHRVKKYDSAHSWVLNFADPGAGADAFATPLDVSVAPDASIWVADRTNGSGNPGSLNKYNSSGVLQDCFGFAVACSQVRSFSGTLRGIANDSSSNIYYSYSSGASGGVTGFDATATGIYNVGGFLGGSDGSFSIITGGVTLDTTDNVYVADTANNRIQKFSPAEAFLFTIGRSDQAVGTGDGEFSGPSDVDIDSGGNIFIVDSGNNRVQKFNSSGTFVSKFGTAGSGDDQLNGPVGVAVDGNDDVYITDSANHRVVKYEKGFEADLTLFTPPLTCGTTYHYRAYATNADGTSFGADEQFTTLDCEIPIARTTGYSGVTASSALLTGSHEDQGSLFATERGFEYGTSTSYGADVSEDGDLYIDSFGGSGAGGNGNFSLVNGVGTDVDGNIYTTDQFEDVIQKFNSAGTFVSQYNVSAPAPGGVTTPSVVRGAPDGKIYALDYVNSKIIRFDDNTFANPTTFAGGAGFNNPTDIAFDSTGNIYVADYSNNRVLKLDSSGTTLLTFGTGAGNALGEFTNPSSVAVDSLGNVYVVDVGNSRIQKFDSTGTAIDQTGSSGSGDGQFTFSTFGYLVIDSEDSLFVSDTTNNRVQKFDTDLNFLSKFGTSGTSAGEFSSPLGIAVGPNGDILVADSGNSRVQIFNERFSLTASGLACGTTYHYRAYATSPDGTGVGSDDTFTTDACPPSGGGGGGGGGGSGTHFICTDPTALNYTPETETGKPKNDTCKYPEKDLSCSVPLYLTKAVRYGDANNPDDVRLLENFLNAYEYKNLPVDGFYSATDRDAVIKWQEKYPVEILKPWGLKHGTGYVYLTSLKKIKEIHEAECARLGQSAMGDHCYLYDRKLKRGDNNVFVKSAQKALQASGSLSGVADGVFGRKTEQAVKDFQILKGLKSDGIIGVGTGHELGQVNCHL